MSFDVVGPTNSERRATQFELIERFDHRNGRRERKLRFIFDHETMSERIDRQRQREAPLVRPPFMGASTPAVCLGPSP